MEKTECSDPALSGGVSFTPHGEPNEIKETTMTYDFLSFIDSEAIREHIRKTNYEFTPAEQAVILTHSYEHTVEEKLEALEYLYGKYTEEEFGADKVGMFGDGDTMPFRERLRNYIVGIGASLALKEASEGYVFIACECEEGYEYDGHDKRYFSCYADAYKQLKELKAENSAEFPECRYEYRIIVMPVGAIRGYRHNYDNEFRLVYVEPILPLDDDFPVLDISEYYVWIPLPFKKGDLVKARLRSGERFGEEIGVFDGDDDETDKLFLIWREIHRMEGNSIDMLCPLERFRDQWNHPLGGDFFRDEFDPLKLDYCNDDDLRHLAYGTKALAMATDENSWYTMKDLLYDYSRGLIKKRDCPVDVHEYLREKLRRH